MKDFDKIAHKSANKGIIMLKLKMSQKYFIEGLKFC